MNCTMMMLRHERFSSTKAEEKPWPMACNPGKSVQEKGHNHTPTDM